MVPIKNTKPFSLTGRIINRVRSVFNLIWASIFIPARRMLVGPRVSNWTLTFETANHFLRMQNIQAFDQERISAGREILDSLVFHSPALEVVEAQKISQEVPGYWFTPPETLPGKVILYLHGGGYAYFARSHLGYIATIAQYAETKTFALDYPLIPENPYPAQLNCALRAYEWILEEVPSPGDITVMGDSAGGNLSLALLLKLRDIDRPMPASVICISPWTDVSNPGNSMLGNEPYDWVQMRMAEKWTHWYLDGYDVKDPMVSPTYAELTNLPPIYIQAGGKEILIDMIVEFYRKAKSQGADVRLDIWESMNHDFQAYGEQLAEAKDALGRIREWIASTYET